MWGNEIPLLGSAVGNCLPNESVDVGNVVRLIIRVSVEVTHQLARERGGDSGHIPEGEAHEPVAFP